LIFPEAANQILHKSDTEKRYVLATMALKAGHLAHRFWGIDLLYRLLSDPETRSQLEFLAGSVPEGDFIRMNGNINPFTVEHRPAVQVFWPVAGAYSELNSRSAYYSREEWCAVRIPVPAWDTVAPLRVDPCDFACVVKISELKILSRTDGRCLWRASLKDREGTVMLSGTAVWLSDEHNISILSTGADPQIYLNTIPRLPDVPLELQLWIKAERDLKSVSQEMALRREAAQAEVMTFREALAEMSRRDEELVAMLEAVQAELSKRDDALSHAETALANQKAVAEVMQAENTMLRSSLAVCREVGRAALAAMRTDLATVGTPLRGIVTPDDIPVTRRVMVRGEPEHGLERDVPVEASIVSEDKLVEISVDVLAAQPMIGAGPPNASSAGRLDKSRLKL
jgi:hypothetical protein